MILIYSIDASEPDKRRRALALIESLPENETVIPWQVACEVAAVLKKMTRSGRFIGDYLETVTALRSTFPIALPGVAVLSRAAALEQSAQLSTWDALLIAACCEAGVRRLYTEDIQSRKVIEDVEIVHPFE